MKRKRIPASKLVIPAGLIIVTVLASSFLLINKSGRDDTPKAGIIDGLREFSGEAFINETIGIFEDAGYRVEVFNPDEVTVELYRSLPSKGYDIIVMRVHCGPLNDVLADGTKIPRGTVFFTTEEYDLKTYRTLQEKNLLAIGDIRGEPEKYYFTIPPWFFETEAPGYFDNSTIILDSCYGFYSQAPLVMADTLIRKGAKEFIGWNGEVQAEHTDRAVIELLKGMLKQNLDTREAVEKVRNLIGPDPFYQSQLYIYPY